mmetsp:Transcript_1624/g.5398  ORF Transcript_1624/g.5398 Transcript_1624/m.5398 type:complete len:348 (-) Transcript_1624:2255-3298(-)
MKLVSQMMSFPFIQLRVCSPTLIQHSPSGTSTPRCVVWMKLLLSVCEEMPVFASWRAKKTSRVGASISTRSLCVRGNILMLLCSQMPRSWSTSVRQLGPYATASSRAALAQTRFPLTSIDPGSFMASANSLWITSAFSSTALSHSYWPLSISGNATAVSPSIKLPARCTPSPGCICTNSSPRRSRVKLSSTRGALSPNTSRNAASTSAPNPTSSDALGSVGTSANLVRPAGFASSDAATGAWLAPSGLALARSRSRLAKWSVGPSPSTFSGSHATWSFPSGSISLSSPPARRTTGPTGRLWRPRAGWALPPECIVRFRRATAGRLDRHCASQVIPSFLYKNEHDSIP